LRGYCDASSNKELFEMMRFVQKKVKDNTAFERKSIRFPSKRYDLSKEKYFSNFCNIIDDADVEDITKEGAQYAVICLN
jgi:hypothetical protein